MKRTHVVVLEINFDERLPVVVAMMQLDVIEDVTRKVELFRREIGEIGGDVAWAIEQKPVPVLYRRAAEMHARLLGKMRRAEQLALEIVRPAMNRANDVACVAFARQHDRLPMPANVRQKLDAVHVANERLRIAASRQHVIVAGLRHHQLVTDIPRRAGKQELPLGVEDAAIRVPRSR